MLEQFSFPGGQRRAREVHLQPRLQRPRGRAVFSLQEGYLQGHQRLVPLPPVPP
jgi:hypothetical protein